MNAGESTFGVIGRLGATLRPAKSRAGAAFAVGVLLVFLPSCGGGGENRSGDQGRGAIDAAGFQTRVVNPFLPLSLTRVKIFEVSERDPDTGKRIETRGENRVLAKTGRVAGAPVLVIDVKEYEDGELVEHTADYHAQARDGSVWYLGERVDDYENGKIVGHEGQWLAGRRGARPGLFMPADPKVGDIFEQERAPGVAEDRSRVVSVGSSVTTPAGRFRDCVRTKDYAPLDRRTEFKHYCRGVGLVREQARGGRFDLVRYR